MDLLFQRGRATAADVQRELQDAPSYGLADEPNWNDPDYGRRIQGYYGYPLI